MLHTYKPSSSIILSIKNPHKNLLGNFKDLSIHRDVQREATLFLYYVVIRNTADVTRVKLILLSNLRDINALVII
jgi:hypothetical protein